MAHICVTGAAGNLGSLTAQYLMQNTECRLSLMTHKKSINYEIVDNARVKIYKCDLSKPDSLDECLHGVETIIHYAGVLFMANPEKFLKTTNTKYFENLIIAAKKNLVKKIILISFPHVEGETTVDSPSTNLINKEPISIHARTRLQEEILLRQNYENGIILRVGMVYGQGILMPDAARWFARKWLLGIWKEPTQIHLISKIDFLECVKNAAILDNIKGTYNIGDDGVQTLQEYLSFACIQWKCKQPWKMPNWMIYLAADAFELWSRVFHVTSPLTRDFITIGKVSYYGDTKRMKKELLASLTYPTMKDGYQTF